MGNRIKKRLNRENSDLQTRLPIKVVQFGEGNFLRGFVDYIIDKLNRTTNFNAGVAVVQPLPSGMIDVLSEQDGLYHLFMKGKRREEEIQEKVLVSCIQKFLNPYYDYEAYLKIAEEEQLEFVISNTTEAGITFDETDTLNDTPHKSFPAKLTALLYKRFQYFKGSENSGLTIIPCELINYNADTLKDLILKYAILWDLGSEFTHWINHSNSFHNTLVDRIVPGYPKDDTYSFQQELEFEDQLIVSSETFLLWVIEGGSELKQKIPFSSIDENIVIVKDMQPYRSRKVRILNGAHTTMVPFSILYGNQTVKQTVDHQFTGKFVKEAIFKEIIPTLELPEEELKSFAEEVLDRFRNPFIKHQLSNIALNSISKFKVRVLPSLLAYQKLNTKLPVNLVFAFACLMRFYGGKWKGVLLPVNDDDMLISRMQQIWKSDSYNEIADKILSEKKFWDQDLTKIPKFTTTIAEALEFIDSEGIDKAYERFATLNS